MEVSIVRDHKWMVNKFLLRGFKVFCTLNLLKERCLGCLTRAGAKAIIRCGGILSEITVLLTVIEGNFHDDTFDTFGSKKSQKSGVHF